MKPQQFGTHMHFNSEAAFPHARRSTARTGTLRTRTPWRGSTNCNRQKEKAHQLKGETLFFFSSKMERARAKECPTARAKECPTAMAKDSTAEAKAIAKAKSQKGCEPKSLGRAFVFTCHFSKQPETLQSAEPEVCCPNASQDGLRTDPS